MKDSARGKADVPGGHLDRRRNQRRPVIVIHRPADYLPRRAVNDRGEEKPSFPRRDIRNVADHLGARRARGEIAVHQVRDRPGRALLRRHRPPRPGLAGDQAQLAHQPPDQLLPGRHALAGQLRGDAPVPVSAVGIIEYVSDLEL